jgi:hypothetical protein
MKPHCLSLRPRRWIRWTAIAAAFAPLCAVAEELPALRQGMWEIKRTVAVAGTAGPAQLIENRQCADPSANMKRQNELVAKSGCKTSPVARQGNAYTFSVECEIQGTRMQSTSTIMFAGDSEYRIDIESHGGGRATKEVRSAQRIGDCTAQ